MAAKTRYFTKAQERYLIRYLSSKGAKTIEVYGVMEVQNGNNCMIQKK
jgi:hypothetical protein